MIVREYVGDTSKGGRKVDEWTAENWQRELEETDVMVIIPQIMKMLLQRALLPISAFDLIVLDECHHAFGKDPMAIVCNLIRANPYQPLVLGMTASPLPCKKGFIGTKITLLENTTGCKLICPKDSLEDLRSHVPTANLAMLRYGYNFTYETREFSSSSIVARQGGSPMNISECNTPVTMRKSNVVLKCFQRSSLTNSVPILPEVAGKLFRTMKDKPSLNYKQQMQLISVTDNASAVMMHAYLRLMHAENLSTFYKLLTTLQLNPVELEAKCKLGFLLPAAGSMANVLSPSALSDMQQVCGQIQRISSDCGLLCGVWALALSMDSKRVDRDSRTTNGSSQDCNTNENPRAENMSTSSVSTIDLDKLVLMAEKLKGSPFPMQSLLDGQAVACCSLLDLFSVLASSLGSDICRRAAEDIISSFDDNATNKDPSDGISRAGNVGESRKESGQGKARNMISTVLLALARAGNNDINSNSYIPEDIDSDSDIDNDFDSEEDSDDYDSEYESSVQQGRGLCFSAGSDGVITTIDINSKSSLFKKNPLFGIDLDDMKMAVCDGCIALVATITRAELQMILTLPLHTATLIGMGDKAKAHEDKEKEIEMIVQLEQFKIRNTPYAISKEALANLIAEVPLREGVSQKSLMGQKLSLVSVKVVALFHLWAQLGKQKGIPNNSSNGTDGDINKAGNNDTKYDKKYSADSKIDGSSNNYIESLALELADDWAAIVFCKMRLTALSLCRLLEMLRCPVNIGDADAAVSTTADVANDTNSILAPEIQDKPIAGMFQTPLRGRCIIGQSNQAEQLNTLKSFGKGDFNLLFATDVAEEGLDLRYCQLVINFDSPDTVKSFIQRRGRARAENSHVISMIPLGVEGAGLLANLTIFCGQEQEMLKHGNSILPVAASLCTLGEVLLVGTLVAEPPIAPLSKVLPGIENDPVLTPTPVFVPKPSVVSIPGYGQLTLLKRPQPQELSITDMDVDNEESSSTLVMQNTISNNVSTSSAIVAATAESIALLLEEGSEDENHITSYTSPSGAFVDMFSSIQLLTQFCSQLPHDQFYNPEPLFYIMKHSVPLLQDKTQLYSCSVLLPSSVPSHIRCLTGMHISKYMCVWLLMI